MNKGQKLAQVKMREGELLEKHNALKVDFEKLKRDNMAMIKYNKGLAQKVVDDRAALEAVLVAIDTKDKGESGITEEPKDQKAIDQLMQDAARVVTMVLPPGHVFFMLAGEAGKVEDPKNTKFIATMTRSAATNYMAAFIEKSSKKPGTPTQ